MKKLILFLVLGLFALTLAACGNGDDDPDDDPDPTAPTISGATDEVIEVGDSFDAMDGVTASDTQDGDLTDSIEVDGEVDTSVADDYPLTYTVTNSADLTTEVVRTITVIDPADVQSFNFRYASSELRNSLFAEMEYYLLDTLYGGIPVFSNSSYVIYADRINLPVEEFVPVMGYAATLGDMNQDDAGLEVGGRAGVAGEYTYRTALAQDPSTFQQWIYDDATSSDVITLFLDSLYYFDFNTNKDGYEVKASMADGMPTMLNAEDLPTGETVATQWSIALKADLEWKFHEDTLADYPNLETDIVAADFVETFKLALDNGWFRAISGGGDFLTAPQEIKNAQDYVDGEADWEDVGLGLTDDGDLYFEFNEQMDEWSVIYWLSSFVMTPIHMGLYEEIGDQYGTSADTTAYNGAFYLEYYEPDRELRLVANDKFHSPERYSITGINFQIIEEAGIRFQEFQAGKLDVGAVDVQRYELYANNPDLKFVPGATTFRIMINGLETPQKQTQQFPDSSWVPEPALANLNFKKAMYFSIDREELAVDVLRTSTPQPYLYTEAYLVDPIEGIPFRNSDEAKIMDSLVGSPENYGYSLQAARDYFADAVEELLATDHYSVGDVIELDLFIFSGSEAQSLFGAFIKQAFEETFNADDFDLSVEVTVDAKPFPGIYYDFMMTGEFDLSIGGISGSTLDAASFMDVFSEDNRGGFTLNWGIDTSSANIDISIPDPDDPDTMIDVTWSFDAIQRSLVGSVEVVNGQEYN